MNNLNIEFHTPVDRNKQNNNILCSISEGYKIGTCCSSSNKGERPMAGWFGIRIMCLSGATCLFSDCCFIELVLYKKSN